MFVFSCKDLSKDKASLEFTKPTPKLEEGRYNVAFLIMDGVYNTELTAPYDIFQHTIFPMRAKFLCTSLLLASELNTNLDSLGRAFAMKLQTP